MLSIASRFWLFSVLLTIGLWSGLRASPLFVLCLYFVWLIFEDLARKLAGNDITLYFTKYFLMAGIVLQLIRRHPWHRRPFPPLLALWIGLWALVVIGNSFNPNLWHPLQALVGIHADLLFLIVFLPAGYWLLQKSDDLRRLMVVICLLSVFPTIVAFVQWVYDPSFLNTTVMVGTELRPINVRGIGEVEIAQVNSVFTEHGRFANYAEMICWYGLSAIILFASPQRNFPQVTGWLGFSMGVMDMLLLAKRRPILNSLVGLLLFVTLALPRRRIFSIFPVRHLSLVVALLVGLYLLYPQTFKSVQDFLLKTMIGSDERPSEIAVRMPSYLEQLQIIGDVGLLGNGTGSVALGLQYLQTRLGIDIPEPITENGFADKAWNYGLLGLLVWCGLLAQLLWELSRGPTHTLDPRWWAFRRLVLCWALPYFTLSQLIGSHFMTDYLAQSYYWFLIGLALRQISLLNADTPPSLKVVAAPCR